MNADTDFYYIPLGVVSSALGLNLSLVYDELRDDRRLGIMGAPPFKVVKAQNFGLTHYNAILAQVRMSDIDKLNVAIFAEYVATDIRNVEADFDAFDSSMTCGCISEFSDSVACFRRMDSLVCNAEAGVIHAALYNSITDTYAIYEVK